MCTAMPVSGEEVGVVVEISPQIFEDKLLVLECCLPSLCLGIGTEGCMLPDITSLGSKIASIFSAESYEKVTSSWK